MFALDRSSAENAAPGLLEKRPFGVTELSRFFFDISTGPELIFDEVGCELASIEAALECARQAALDLAAEHLRQAAAKHRSSRKAPAAILIRGIGSRILGTVDVVETASRALCGVKGKQIRSEPFSYAWVVAETDVERRSAAEVIGAYGYRVQKLASLDAVLEVLAEFGLEKPELRLGQPLLFVALNDVAESYGALLSLRTACPTLFFAIASDSPALRAIDVISLPRAFTWAELHEVLRGGLNWPA